MFLRVAGFLAALAFSNAPSGAMFESGVAVVPAGMTTVEALLTASEALLRQEGFRDITTDPKTGTLHASQTMYNTVSVGGSGVQKDTTSWSLEVDKDDQGRIVATVHWESSTGREQNEIPKFVANIVAGVLLNSTRIQLTYHGESHTVLEWSQKARESS